MVGGASLIPTRPSFPGDNVAGLVANTCPAVLDYGLVNRTRGANMAKRQKYQVEKTSVGLQYVIPGAERIVPVATPPMLYSTDGAQFVIPGAEQISTGELLMRKMAEPIRPRTRQRGLAGTALFGGLG